MSRNKEEHTAYRKEFKKYCEEIVKTTKSIRDFLFRAGINTPDGKLTKPYQLDKDFIDSLPETKLMGKIDVPAELKRSAEFVKNNKLKF